MGWGSSNPLGDNEMSFSEKVDQTNSTTNDSIVKIQNVSHGYGRKGEREPVITDFSLDIPRGKITVLIGPSGCGKSTLVRLIAGFERPDKGQVLMNGQLVLKPSPDRLVVFQESALFSWMTTSKNVSFGPSVRGQRDPETKSSIEKILEVVGLRAFQSKYPTQLSGGMQRRAELARALVNDPKVMVLDEPFRGLDAMTKALMQQHFNELMASSSVSCVFITSDIDEALLLADQIVITTNKPLRVASVIQVTFLKPRTSKQLVESDEANDLKFSALKVLHTEAMKSFASGSKAAEDFLRAYSSRANISQ
jgi:NitT/TauT family transport system ATP-binding protein